MLRTTMLLVVLLGGLCLEVGGQPATPPAPLTKEPPKFATGWMSQVYQALEDLQTVPLDALGAFVDTTGAPYTFALSKQREGLTGFKGLPAYRFTGGGWKPRARAARR